MIAPLIVPIGAPGGQGRPDLERAAGHLEAAFLAEMLKPMGAIQAPETLGGGAGEQQFASFLVDEYARLIVASGGIGLSESIIRSLIASGQSLSPNDDRL
jgi:Rod binding domain-containing protein